MKAESIFLTTLFLIVLLLSGCDKNFNGPTYQKLTEENKQLALTNEIFRTILDSLENDPFLFMPDDELGNIYFTNAEEQFVIRLKYLKESIPVKIQKEELAKRVIDAQNVLDSLDNIDGWRLISKKGVSIKIKSKRIYRGRQNFYSAFSFCKKREHT